MKFRFALLVAALALALSISAFAYSEEPTQDAAAPAQEETTSEDSSPFVLLRVYEGQFADVKGGSPPRSSRPMNTAYSTAAARIPLRQAAM